MDEIELQKCLNNTDYLAKRYFFNQKYCMAYDKKSCGGDIINAHTISKKYINNKWLQLMASFFQLTLDIMLACHAVLGSVQKIPFSINRRISSTRQAVIRGPNFIG